MRLTGAIACGIVALDCANKAVGNQPQDLFFPDSVWLWWVVAFFWTVSAVKLLILD
jgi:hypothetical protein